MTHVLVIRCDRESMVGKSYRINDNDQGKYYIFVGNHGYHGEVSGDHIQFFNKKGARVVFIINEYRIMEEPAVPAQLYALRLDHEIIRWLKMQPDASITVHDALRFWMKYMGDK